MTIFVFILEMLVSAEECEGVSVASPVQKREARQHTNVCRAQGAGRRFGQVTELGKHCQRAQQGPG